MGVLGIVCCLVYYYYDFMVEHQIHEAFDGYLCVFVSFDVWFLVLVSIRMLF